MSYQRVSFSHVPHTPCSRAEGAIFINKNDQQKILCTVYVPSSLFTAYSSRERGEEAEPARCCVLGVRGRVWAWSGRERDSCPPLSLTLDRRVTKTNGVGYIKDTQDTRARGGFPTVGLSPSHREGPGRRCSRPTTPAPGMYAPLMTAIAYMYGPGPQGVPNGAHSGRLSPPSDSLSRRSSAICRVRG